MPQWTCPKCNIIMDSGHPCRACGRGLAEAFGAKLPTQREQEEQAREQAEWLMNPAEAAQARDASARAASRRKLWEAQGREERAQKAAHIQDTVARAEAEAKRGSHPVSEAEIWKGIVEKDSRISKQLETLCFWARIIGIPFLIAAAIGALKLIGDVAKEIHGS